MQKTVQMIDKSGNLVQVFSSVGDAARYLIEIKATKSKIVDGIASHITQVCNGKRNSAYGYCWKYLSK